MSVNRIAERYAKSLLDLAIEKDDLTQVVQDVDVLRRGLESRDLYLLIKSPIIAGPKKRDIFGKLFDDKLGAISRSFIDIIIRKGRENVLPEMIGAFDTLYKSYQKVSTIILKTADPISDGALAKIKTKLLESSSTLSNIEIKTEVDPSLLGGFKLEFGDRQFDSSLASKLKDLRKQFSKNTYQKKI